MTTEETGRETAPRPPRAVQVAQWMFLVIAAVWVAFALMTLLASSATTAVGAWLMALLMCATAAALAWLAWGIGKQDRRYWVSGLLVLGVNVVLTITDEFGVFDLVTLILDLGLVGLLLATRSLYPPRAGRGA